MRIYRHGSFYNWCLKIWWPWHYARLRRINVGRIDRLLAKTLNQHLPEMVKNIYTVTPLMEFMRKRSENKYSTVINLQYDKLKKLRRKKTRRKKR